MSDRPTIVDSHHHLLDPGRIDYRVLRYLPEIDRFIGPDELAPLLRGAGVDRTVIVQAEESEAETDYITELAGSTEWIAGVVGWVPLADPDATGAALERHQGGPLVGVRHGLFWEPDESWICQDAVVESIGLLAKHGLTYDLVPMADRHWDAVAMLGERVPDLRLVIDHMGHPKIKDGEWEPWATHLARSAEHPGAVLKLSALDMSTWSVDVEAFRRYVDHALEHFGPRRMLWGSNWPVSLKLQGYGVLLESARELVAGCTPEEQAEIFGGTAARVYRL
jgi:L-fuconolactonase